MRLLAILILAGHALLALALLLVAVRLWPPCLGIDLGGGVRLVYAVGQDPSDSAEETRDASEVIPWSSLVDALRNRVDPRGTRDVVVRPYGEGQVEIIVPEVNAVEIQQIKRLIGTAGRLEFRIVANTHDHEETIALAKQQAQDPDPTRRLSKSVARKAVTEGVATNEQVARRVRSRSRC